MDLEFCFLSPIPQDLLYWALWQAHLMLSQQPWDVNWVILIFMRTSSFRKARNVHGSMWDRTSESRAFLLISWTCFYLFFCHHVSRVAQGWSSIPSSPLLEQLGLQAALDAQLSGPVFPWLHSEQPRASIAHTSLRYLALPCTTQFSRVTLVTVHTCSSFTAQEKGVASSLGTMGRRLGCPGLIKCKAAS